MRVPTYNPNATKRPVNLTLNSDLVVRARAEGLNLSALAEEAVAAALAHIAKARLTRRSPRRAGLMKNISRSTAV
jgi:post-segregation antitoxin (ccd killing protein)